jgi:hypothetical protein
MSRLFRFSRRAVCVPMAAVLLLFGYLRPATAQNGNGINPLTIFQNYFVTGDYVVAGWRAGAPDGSGYAPGSISIPDTLQPAQNGVPATVPVGADIVAAYLYWATVESNKSSFAGQTGFFNGYPITGTVLGNPNAPTSWSDGGCAGSAQGSKTMRTYRADVHPYLPLDTNPTSVTFGATIARGKIPVRLADSGSNGNKTPIALGATLVVIYRVLSPAVPLNSITIYDGAFAPSNCGSNFSQQLIGFYQPATTPIAKITHIVANGQPNKGEQVFLNNAKQPLPSLYGSLPPFPGVYGSWDNPTWVLSRFGYVKPTDTSETTSVVPSFSNRGCVSWGAVILSTSVQDTDNDGLLDVWENNQGYTDAVSGQWVSLPGANPNKKDLFVELDWLSNLDGSAGPSLHSHLPKEAAIDAVGTVFANQGISVHFDLGAGIYQGDPYVISYPVNVPNPLPPGTSPPPSGTGGNPISEGSLLCADGATLCAYPGQPAIGWKGSFESIKNSANQGNFQSGRSKSYHYILSGHSLGAPISYWSTVGAALADPTIPQLISIVSSGNTATITLKSPQGVTNPGDCANPSISGCSSPNNNRISITGALSQTALNGSYLFSNVSSSTANGITTTTFTVSTQGVTSGTYNYSVEPQLAVTYLGPTSTSGQSEFGGGGDSAVTLGLWGADDPANCQPDPAESLSPGQVYCNNDVGTTQVQTGTLLHELGHTLSLTHGGTYYEDPNNPSRATYELNCKPNYLSVMNYLFQVRGFADGGIIDFSSQTLSPLNEAYPYLNEANGVGTDINTQQPAVHLTRWYSTPSALDQALQKASGGRFASSHCDGTPLGPNDVPGVRVDGSVAPGGTFSGPLDWNNDSIVPDAVNPPGIDVNYNGITGDPAFSGFDDSQGINLQQIDARENAFGYSGGGVKFAGGGIKFAGGGVDNDGGGVKFAGGGVKFAGGGIKFEGGGVDQNEETAASTADPASGLTCTDAIGKVAGCVQSSKGLEVQSSVPLTWMGPGFGQTRSYTIYRAVGSFTTQEQVLANLSAFSALKTLSGAPPATSFIDTTVKSGQTYTYFVTDANLQGIQSGISNLLVVTVNPNCRR